MVAMGIRSYLKRNWGFYLLVAAVVGLILYLTVREMRESAAKRAQEAAEREGWAQALNTYHREVQDLQAELDDCKKERSRHAP
jgi:cell division protein FtsB